MNLRVPQTPKRCFAEVCPWVRVPGLGSHALGLAASRVGPDWQRQYGHGIELLETFVQGQRFDGACYRAAGWRHVGRTTGRTRNHECHTAPGLPKEVFVQPLRPGWKARLTA